LDGWELQWCDLDFQAMQALSEIETFCGVVMHLTLSFAINTHLLMGGSRLPGHKNVSEQCCPICISAALIFSLLFVIAVIIWTAPAEC